MEWISLRVCRLLGTPALAPLLIMASAATLRAEPPEKSEIRVARLIRDLGAADFHRREQADEQLGKLGPSGRAHLEQASADADPEVRLRAQRLLGKLKLDELWAPTAVHYQAQGEPASKILPALAAQSGNHIHVGDPYGNFSETKLDVNYAGLSYWEAVDDICHRTGNRMRPHYDMHTPGIVVSAGVPGNFPRAYGGPVRAQITDARRVFIEQLNYEEHKAELTHSFQLNLKFAWEDRFRIVGYAVQPELVEAVTDNHVVISAAAPAGGGWNAISRGLRQIDASLKLNPVPVSARSFDVLRIKWGLIAVGAPATLEMAQIEPTKVYSQDDLAVEIETIERQPAQKFVISFSVVRDLAMPDPQEIVFQEYETELYDAQGRAFRLQNQSHSLSSRGVQYKATFLGDSAGSEPSLMKLQYPRLRARRDVELVFRNVPLPVGKPE